MQNYIIKVMKVISSCDQRSPPSEDNSITTDSLQQQLIKSIQILTDSRMCRTNAVSHMINHMLFPVSNTTPRCVTHHWQPEFTGGTGQANNV